MLGTVVQVHQGIAEGWNVALALKDYWIARVVQNDSSSES